MKKLILFLLSVSVFTSCGSKEASTPTPVAVKTLAEKIKKAWTPTSVTVAGIVVYTKGNASSLKPGYSNFKIDLSSATTAALTEFDGTTFQGNWEVSGGTNLILKNLSPQPSGVSGNIEYGITEGSETLLKLNRSTTNPKTGGESVSYVLE